jgi:hypothetical protein
MADEGWVYILTNEAMPDFIKIGLTRQNDVSVRIKQLDNTSTPLPFECHFAARVPDCAKLERTLHFVFGEKRARASREFFKADPALVKAIIELVALEETLLTDAEQEISPAQRADIEEVRAVRTKRRTLASVGLVPGDMIVFTKDPLKIATVQNDRQVLLEGDTVPMTVSAAALKLINAMGYNWPAVSGFDYWRFHGVLLRDLDVTAQLPSGNETSDFAFP